MCRNRGNRPTLLELVEEIFNGLQEELGYGKYDLLVVSGDGGELPLQKCIHICRSLARTPSQPVFTTGATSLTQAVDFLVSRGGCVYNSVGVQFRTAPLAWKWRQNAKVTRPIEVRHVMDRGAVTIWELTEAALLHQGKSGIRTNPNTKTRSTNNA